MKRKLQQLSITLVLLAISTAAAAQITWAIGTPTAGNVTATLSSDGTLTISGTGAMKNYTRDHADFPWTASAVKKLKISSTVTNIGNCAFQGCSNLTDIITLQERPGGVAREIAGLRGVISIGEGAFSETALTEIILGNSVTTIGDGAFYDCRKLQTVTFGTGITSIGEWAFSECGRITDITIPCNVNIGADTFTYNNITKLTISGTGAMQDYTAPPFTSMENLATVIIGNGVTHIGDNAFGWIGNITSVTIGTAVKSIGEYAFGGCGSLPEIIIPNSVESIGDYVFSECTALASVQLGTGVKSIGAGVFDVCVFTAIDIPNGVETIGDWAFNGVPLTEIIIPASVNTIGEGAFAYSGLTDILFLGNKPSLGADMFQYIPADRLTLHYPCENASWAGYTPPAGVIDGCSTGGGTQYTVTFDSNGGSKVLPATVYEHSTVTAPENPTRTGYTFGGWYKDDVVFDFSTPITENITLTAQWTFTTGIGEVPADGRKVTGYYTLTGIKLQDEPASGFYIIMYDNGRAEKRMKSPL